MRLPDIGTATHTIHAIATAITALSCFAAATLLTAAAPPQAVAQTIFEAADEGDAETVRALLEADPELVGARDDDDRTPLHYATSSGHVEIALVLLDAGAEIDAAEVDGETALHYAAWRSDLATGWLLIERGADLEAANRMNRTPLLTVGRETGHVEMAVMLLDAGAEINARDRSEWSSLDLAAWRGFADLVEVLLDRGAELSPADSRLGQMVAMFAADKGLVRLFDLSVDAGVDLSLRNGSDGSLLHSASQGGSAEIVARLLGEGFDPNGHDRYARTPLHYAAEMGREDVALLLLDSGADIDARSLSGETAFNTAEWVDREAMARFLAASGADTRPRLFPELTGAFMGQQPPAPGTAPALFAADIVSTHRFQHGTLTFSPDGDEAFWSSQIATQAEGYSEGMLLTSRIENGRWKEPSPVTFSELGLGDDVPVFAPDGDRLFFLSRRPAPGEEERGAERIWYVVRTEDGWSEPQIIEGGPNSIELHWQFSVAADGSLYVPSRGNLYLSRLVDGRYAEPESLGAPVNSDADEDMPYIGPDGSYLLFSRRGHPGNVGWADLWISFREGSEESGGWSEPVNLGESINRVAGSCPMMSPDGRYLFFNGGNNDNYWVDAGFLARLRAQSEGGETD